MFYNPRTQSACSKSGRGSDRMTHNASAAAAAAITTGKRNEKGTSTTMQSHAIIFSNNYIGEYECVRFGRPAIFFHDELGRRCNELRKVV